jgi:hypothetical protein
MVFPRMHFEWHSIDVDETGDGICSSANPCNQAIE